MLQFYPTSDDQVQLITSIAQKAGFGGGVVVDYPNSKKARKVFLCLFVGGGGATQVPKGLDVGDGVGEEDDSKAKFEKRRQREMKRAKSGKTKKVIGKEWILKKKEVCSTFSVSPANKYLCHRSCTGGAAKRTCLAIQNTQVGSGRQRSDTDLCHSGCFHYYRKRLYPQDTKSSIVLKTASFGGFLMNNPCKAAILTLRPALISLLIISFSSSPRTSS